MELAGAVTSLGTLTDAIGKVTYNGGAVPNQNIFADTYYDLTVSNAGTKDLGGTVNVNRDLTIDVGVTLDVTGGNHPINIKRDFSNNGTFTSRDGTITFNGNDNQGFIPGPSTFYNIIFNTTGGALKKLIIDDGAGHLVMTHDLTITAGTFNLADNASAFTIAGDISIANGAGWAKGGLVTFNGGAVPQTFTDANSPRIVNLGDIAID